MLQAVGEAGPVTSEQTVDGEDAGDPVRLSQLDVDPAQWPGASRVACRRPPERGARARRAASPPRRRSRAWPRGRLARRPRGRESTPSGIADGGGEDQGRRSSTPGRPGSSRGGRRAPAAWTCRSSPRSPRRRLPTCSSRTARRAAGRAPSAPASPRTARRRPCPPRATRAGSAGRTWERMKVTRLMPMRTKTSPMRRRIRNERMPWSQVWVSKAGGRAAVLSRRRAIRRL